MTDTEIVKQFVENHTHENPGSVVPLAALLRRFKQEADREGWSRSRFLVAAARAGFPLAEAHDRRTVIVGRSLRPATRLEIVAGRVVRV